MVEEMFWDWLESGNDMLLLKKSDVRVYVSKVRVRVWRKMLMRERV